MIEQYKILYQGGSGTIIEKKSRFIVTTMPVETEARAIEFIEGMKKQYWDASHNCSAYVIGSRGEIKRCSDDGEPSQTAGRPMLDILEGEEIRNVCVVVTRYFGGTLLGTGGLVRAYAQATKEGLNQSVIVEKRLGKQMLITTDYNGLGKIQYIVAQLDVTILDTIYTDQVIVSLMVPNSLIEKFLAQVTEKTGGKAIIQEQGDLYYGMLGKEVLLWK